MTTQHTAHIMKPDADLGAECLHWIDQHTGDEVSTYGWINGMTTDYFDVLRARSGKTAFGDVVRWVDQEATTEQRGVEALIDEICEESSVDVYHRFCQLTAVFSCPRSSGAVGPARRFAMAGDTLSLRLKWRRL